MTIYGVDVFGDGLRLTSIQARIIQSVRGSCNGAGGVLRLLDGDLCAQCSDGTKSRVVLLEVEDLAQKLKWSPGIGRWVMLFGLAKLKGGQLRMEPRLEGPC